MADVKGLEVESGQWLAANCGKFPSDRNCKLVMMAPESQKSDLVNAAVAHAVKDHGHQDTPELRAELGGILDKVSV
ncbi:MAG TPA: DUF1059 domain-containing protein [Dehalococcoidia bacterium]|nr:DUF1059 domain-containing protein [Dehalococcoidia bacterium]